MYDEVSMKSPLLCPDRVARRAVLSQPQHYQMDFGMEGEEPRIDSEISESNAKNATIESIIELFLTGSATGLNFSPVGPKRFAEVYRLLTWLRIKLITKVNKQSLRATLIQLANSFTTSVIFNSAFIVQLINYNFDFKARIVANAIAEYTTWLATRVGTTYAIKEYDPGALPLLTKYWNATPTPPSSIDPGQAWSAAFVSWVIREAGATDLFPYSDAHIKYIRAARINSRDSVQNPFWLFKISEFITRMQPGDMLCKARSGSGLTFNNVLTSTEKSAHVDIITAIDLPNKRIRAIGGNVCDNVDHKGFNIVGATRITNSDGDDYFAGIGIGNA